MRLRVGEGAVAAAPVHLRRRPLEPDVDLVAFDADLDREAHVRVDSVGVDPVLVAPVRQIADRLAHRRLGPALHHGGQRLEVVHAVLLHELADPLGPGEPAATSA